MIRTFTFDGISSEGQLFVNKVTRPMSPNKTIYYRNVPKRHGAIIYDYKYEPRIIEVTVTIMGDNDVDLWTRIDNLNSWLFTETPAKLIFNDDPNKYYLAILSEETNLDTLISIGTATLTFLCGDPFKHSLYEQSVTMGVGYGKNLIPYYTFTDLTRWTDWYNVITETTETFENGASVLRAEMTNFESNPRMRIVMGSNNRAVLTGGETYTFSFKIEPSADLVKLEYLSYIVYNADGTSVWINLNPSAITLTDLPVDEYGWRIYTYTFVADRTGEHRMSMGFGLGNPAMKNGSWFRLRDFKVEEGTKRTETNIDNTTTSLAEVANSGNFKTFPVLRLIPTTTITSPVIVTKRKTGERVILNVDGNNPLTADQPILIDHKSNYVYNEQTEESLMKFLDLESVFFDLSANETNEIETNFDPEVLVSTVIFTERWL